MSIVLEAVAGAALSAFFDVLFDKLSSPDLLNIFRRKNVDADLKNWETILQEISEVLDDAEEKQITKVSVKNWMAELEDLAYDADDILDEFATEALRRKVNAEEPSTSKIRKLIPACCVGLNPRSIMFDANMGSKIKGINTRLDGIVTRKNKLELLHGRRGTRTITSREPETSLVEPCTYGRDDDKKAIVKLLLSGESGGAQPSTISILGMGGLGKTTLAKLVYNDDEVGRYFVVKAWCCVTQDFDTLKVTKKILKDVTSKTCNDNDLDLVQRVSQDFDTVRVTKKILKVITSKTCNDNDLDSVQRELKKQLSGKRFLLILDDVWSENYSAWTKLRLPFESGAPGSRILITTRHANVSSTMGASHPYELRELSNDACWAMFAQAFSSIRAPGTSSFVEHLKVGERQKILERCKGLPLAAKALAGLLLTYNRDEWKDVLNGRIWDLLEEKTDVPSTLRLSYLCLPSSLKKCFAYCSLFPKGYKFQKEELVLLWMAEGLVRETREKSMEDLGREYFHHLLKRSFFQRESIHNIQFVMHDLMHDLAQWAAGDLCCRLEDHLGGRKISPKVRHFSYINHSISCIKNFDDFPKDMHLRTFLLKSPRCFHNSINSAIFLLPQLRYLRVISLNKYSIQELPSSISDLKHLRYLNLSFHVEITSLPESTSSLYNLQTLILKGCHHLTKLPKKIENLVNLRHLNITCANSITEMPTGIAKLKSLRTLCFEDMVEWQDWIPCKVECEEFPCLRELSISNCPKLGKFSFRLPSLEKLSIYKCEHLVVSIISDSELQELKIVGCKEVVHGSLKVEKLIIKNCKELKSLCKDELMSLVTLEIEIESCQSLVNINLKSTLRKLKIKDCSALESLQFVMDEGGASSTSSLLMNEENLSCIDNNNASLLERLKISNCPSLKCVSTIVDLAARLKCPDIEECPNLTSLSSRGLHKLCHLKEIDIYKCNSLISLGDLLPANLRNLEIIHCEKLDALPNNIHSLHFLQDLSICKCPSIVSFPEEGFPTNLRKLRLSGANLCKQVFELGLHRLTSLTYLWIANGIMDSFPEEEDGKTMLMLPTSLTTLSFGNFPNLLFLSWKFFQNRSALEEIYIGWCPELASLSEKCIPPSLQRLEISGCPVLSLSEECFPLSLQRLEIYECPVLKQNCEKDKGIMWSKIAKIPSVMIDYVEQQK